MPRKKFEHCGPDQMHVICFLNGNEWSSTEEIAERVYSWTKESLLPRKHNPSPEKWQQIRYKWAIRILKSMKRRNMVELIIGDDGKSYWKNVIEERIKNKYGTGR